MENLLVEFIDTLDTKFKSLYLEIENNKGLSKLTINQFQYIDAIYEIGEPTITEVANKLNITKASTTTGLKKLVNMGYVIKTQSSADKRVYHVTLTEVGEQLITAKYQAFREYGEFVLRALNKSEVAQFKLILTKIIKYFKEEKNCR